MTRQSVIHPRYIMPKLAANSQLSNTHGCSTTAAFQGYQKPLETSQFGKVKTRKKRRSKFDVSHFYDGSNNKPYFMNQYSSSDFNGSNNQNNFTCGRFCSNFNRVLELFLTCYLISRYVFCVLDKFM